MRNIDVIESFLKQDSRLYIKTTNLKRKGQYLVNYSTVIANMVDEVLFVNKKKYSRSTTIIQNKLRQLASDYDIVVMEAEDEFMTVKADEFYIIPEVKQIREEQ